MSTSNTSSTGLTETSDTLVTTSGTSLTRRGSLSSHSFIRKMTNKKLAPMSQIPGIKQASKQHQSKKSSGVVPKYGVHVSNPDVLNEVIHPDFRLNSVLIEHSIHPWAVAVSYSTI